jgi:toxin ParE1/3/4
MARLLRWTEDAADDIVAIAEFISRDSEFYAKAVVQKIMEKVATIPEEPEIGRMVPEIESPELRERFVYSYRIIYQITDNAIWLIAIFSGKQPIEERLDERLES